MVAEKSFVVQLNKQCECDGCVRNVKEVLKKARVFGSSEIDMSKGKVTVTGSADQHALLAALRKEFKRAEILVPERLEYSKSLQIVPAKPVERVHDTRSLSPPQQQQVSLQVSGNINDDESTKKSDNNYDNDGDNNNYDDFLYTSARISDSSHKHDLVLKKYNKPFICSGCKEIGFGPRFRCESCDYELHEECKECLISEPQISHEIFEDCIFRFYDHLPNKVCDACGKDICGFLYHSDAEGKSLDLHPCCSKLKSKICIDGHDFELHHEVLSKCKWCDKKDLHGSKLKGVNVSGWSYISGRKRCHFHVYCVAEMVGESWRKGFIDNIDSMAIMKMNLQLVVNSNRRSGGRASSEIGRRPMKLFLKAIVGVLLGDPTMLLGSVLVDLFTS